MFTVGTRAAGTLPGMSHWPWIGWDARTDQNIQQSRSVCLWSLSSDLLMHLLFLHRNFSG